MAEENQNQNQVEGQGTPGEGAQPSRSEQRQKDLADKLKEQERLHAVQIEEEKTARTKVEGELKQARFETDLLKESAKFPHAIEFKDDIKAYTDKGLSVNEATTLVLSQKNKLVTGTEAQRESVEASSFGGSSVNAGSSGTKAPSEMTQAERRAELEKLEAKGNFGINEGSLFIKD